MKITKMSIKNKTMKGEDLEVELTFEYCDDIVINDLVVTINEKDLTNLKNDLQYIYDEFMKFKGV